MNERISAQVAVNVSYGVGASCEGHFAREAVEGLSARQLLERVVECRQADEPAARTAVVLGEVLRSSRQIDVELIRGGGAAGPGRPIVLDDAVVRAPTGGDTGTEQDDYTILVSESYRGGA